MFSQNNRIRIRGFHRFSKSLPEKMVKFRAVPQIRGYIQPPSIRIVRGRNPFLRDMENIMKKLPGIFIIQFRKRVMPPPAVISAVIRPFMIIIKAEIIMVGTFLCDISPFLITFHIFIDSFFVYPFIERTAMIEDAVQNHSDASSVRLFHHFGKKSVACLQIFFIGYTVNIFCGKTVLMLTRL